MCLLRSNPVTRLRKRFLDCSQLSLEEAEQFGDQLAPMQRDIMFWIGDLVRYAEHKWPDSYHQCFPPDVSPGLLARAAGVCRAYPNESDRRHEATYSQYMRVAGKPDRHEQLASIVEQGLTTDESRRKSTDSKARWLLAIDCNYYLHRWWHSGAGVEAATGVSSWIERTVERLKEKGLTDVACCFDSHENHRKELTKDWDDKYKDRPPKDHELSQQLTLVRELLDKAGFAVVSVDGMEADDVMASYAKQFDGKVTLLTQDKDQRQCLSGKCNILLDVEWIEEPNSGDKLPEYKWLSAKTHTEETGITPERWTDYQCLMGDNVDGIRGAEGIGKKGAADLVQEFGTVEAVIEAAHEMQHAIEQEELTEKDATIKQKKRDALFAFKEKLEVTRQLVTLRDDLNISTATRLT